MPLAEFASPRAVLFTPGVLFKMVELSAPATSLESIGEVVVFAARSLLTLVASFAAGGVAASVDVALPAVGELLFALFIVASSGAVAFKTGALFKLVELPALGMLPGAAAEAVVFGAKSLLTLVTSFAPDGVTPLIDVELSDPSKELFAPFNEAPMGAVAFNAEELLTLVELSVVVMLFTSTSDTVLLLVGLTGMVVAFRAAVEFRAAEVAVPSADVSLFAANNVLFAPFQGVSVGAVAFRAAALLRLVELSVLARLL